MDYKTSGVDIDAGNEAIRRIKGLAKSTFTAGVLSEIGSFGGLFRLDPTAWTDPISGLERRRCGHQAQDRLSGTRTSNHRARPRQSLRERHPCPGGAAALFPRLPGDRASRARASPSRLSKAWRAGAARTAVRCLAARRRRCRAFTPRANTISPASSSARSRARR